MSSSTEHVLEQPSTPGLNKMTQSIWYSLGSHAGTCPFWVVPRQGRCCLGQICQRPLNLVPSGRLGGEAGGVSESTFQAALPSPLFYHHFALIMNSNGNFYSQFRLDSSQFEISHLVCNCEFKRLKIAAFIDKGLFYFWG